MEGFDSEIDTEFSSGLFGGSSFFVAFSQKRLSIHALEHDFSLNNNIYLSFVSYCQFFSCNSLTIY